MELEYYSNDHIEPIVENMNTRLEITPAPCNPRPVKDWFRWNLYFKNYASVDVTNTLVWLIEHGYRLYEDAYLSWKRDPKKCHFVATKQGVITIPCYFDSPLDGRTRESSYGQLFDDYHIVANLKSIRLLALQRNTPDSMVNQITWVKDLKRRGGTYLIICDCDTVEEWFSKNKITEGKYWPATFEELIYPKALQILQSIERQHAASMCRSKRNECWLCQRTTCMKRKNNAPKKEKVVEEILGVDLL